MNAFIQGILILLLAPALTCAIEIPIIRAFKITKNIIYIIAVNVSTNLFLNIILVVLNAYFNNAGFVWLAVSEAILIPVGEAELYNLISEKKRKRIYAATYVANLSSFLIGMIIEKLIF